jgi:hypothetical protein
VTLALGLIFIWLSRTIYAGIRNLKKIWISTIINSKANCKVVASISPLSFSNYNYTPFSIASMLQMDYLGKIDRKNSSHNDLSICYSLIRENKVVTFLRAYNYKLYNYSIFDIFDQPAMITESILPEKTKFITARLVVYRIDKNILFNMTNRLGAKQKWGDWCCPITACQGSWLAKNIATRKRMNQNFVYAQLINATYPWLLMTDSKIPRIDRVSGRRMKGMSLIISNIAVY